MVIQVFVLVFLSDNPVLAMDWWDMDRFRKLRKGGLRVGLAVMCSARYATCPEVSRSSSDVSLRLDVCSV